MRLRFGSGPRRRTGRRSSRRDLSGHDFSNRFAKRDGIGSARACRPVDPGQRRGGGGDQCGGLGGVSGGIAGAESSDPDGAGGALFCLAGGGGSGRNLRPGGARVAATGETGGQQRSLDRLHGLDARSGAVDEERGGDGAGARLAGDGILIGRYWVRTSDLLRVKQALYR